MGFKASGAVLAVATVVFACTPAARADRVAATVSNVRSAQGADRSVFGWSFVPSANIEVTALGVLDQWQTGLRVSHSVGIWQATNTTTPLITATVPSGTAASLEGGFRYVPATRTLLLGGTTYVVGAYYYDPAPGVFGDNTVTTYDLATIWIDPLITPKGRRYADYADRLMFPDHIDNTSHSPYCFGPGFKFEPVPEPATITLLVAGAIAGLVGWAWRKRTYFKLSSTLLVAALMVFAAGTAEAVDVFNMGGTRDPATGQWTGLASLEMVPVGNPGNAADPNELRDHGRAPSAFGRVDYLYNIGKYEVTAGQYTAFLNAVAKTSDTYGLYNSNMWTSTEGCKIQQTGTLDSYNYSVAADYANRPVNWVSFWDACRFANWLHNGQPTGEQGAGTTETGAYTLTATGMNNNTIVRNADWKWAVTSENEWYKAAYHNNDGVTDNYWEFPTKSNVTPGRDMVDHGNNANYYDYGGSPPPIDAGKYYTTTVGEFEASPSPYGTFDQGGNVLEWNDSILFGYGDSRVIHGGSFNNTPESMLDQDCYTGIIPVYEGVAGGFRVVSVESIPEPGTITLLIAGVVAGLVWRRQRRRTA